MPNFYKTAATKPHRIGLAADHDGFELKQYLSGILRETGYYHVTVFGDKQLEANDDYPDFVFPLAHAVAVRMVDRGVAICGSGVGACVAASNVAGVHACLIHERFSAHQSIEDDDLNVICPGGLVVGHEAAWEFVQASLEARFSGAEHHHCRLAKVAEFECRPSREMP